MDRPRLVICVKEANLKETFANTWLKVQVRCFEGPTEQESLEKSGGQQVSVVRCSQDGSAAFAYRQTFPWFPALRPRIILRLHKVGFFPIARQFAEATISVPFQSLEPSQVHEELELFSPVGQSLGQVSISLSVCAAFVTFHGPCEGRVQGCLSNAHPASHQQESSFGLVHRTRGGRFLGRSQMQNVIGCPVTLNNLPEDAIVVQGRVHNSTLDAEPEH
jgi:hypothetical protein